MKAVTWHGRRDVCVDDVSYPRIEEPTDAIVRVTSTRICGSDLHLHELLGPFLDPGDILGRCSTPSTPPGGEAPCRSSGFTEASSTPSR
jgi:threonine dehydrogenase-like Zn-dependent dehydrogenase